MLYIYLFINEKKHCEIGEQKIKYKNIIINYDFTKFNLNSIYFDVKVTCIETNKKLINNIFENFGYIKIMEKVKSLSTEFYFSKLLYYKKNEEEIDIPLIEEFRKLITCLYSYGLKRDKILKNTNKIIEFIMY